MIASFQWLLPHSRFSSVTQSCLTLCDPMDYSMPDLPVHHQLLEFTQTHIHRVGDAIQPSHPLSSPSPPAPNPSQHQSLFQWVNSSHEVAKDTGLLSNNMHCGEYTVDCLVTRVCFHEHKFLIHSKISLFIPITFATYLLPAPKS